MIGIFDSGVGGMTVARAIETLCPGFPFVYLGDLARSPYGSKSPAMITEYSQRNTEFLLRQGAKIIVIACNSAASVITSYSIHYTKLYEGNCPDDFSRSSGVLILCQES